MDNLEAYRQVVEQRDEHAGHVEHLMRVVEGQRHNIQKLQGENNTLREKIRVDLHALKNLVAHLEVQTQRANRDLQPMAANTCDQGSPSMANMPYEGVQKVPRDLGAKSDPSPPQTAPPQDHDFNEQN